MSNHKTYKTAVPYPSDDIEPIDAVMWQIKHGEIEVDKRGRLIRRWRRFYHTHGYMALYPIDPSVLGPFYRENGDYLYNSVSIILGGVDHNVSIMRILYKYYTGESAPDDLKVCVINRNLNKFTMDNLELRTQREHITQLHKDG